MILLRKLDKLISGGFRIEANCTGGRRLEPVFSDQVTSKCVGFYFHNGMLIDNYEAGGHKDGGNCVRQICVQFCYLTSCLILRKLNALYIKYFKGKINGRSGLQNITVNKFVRKMQIKTFGHLDHSC